MEESFTAVAEPVPTLFVGFWVWLLVVEEFVELVLSPLDVSELPCSLSDVEVLSDESFVVEEVSSETVSVICEELLLSTGTSDVGVANDPANNNTTAKTIVNALLSFNLLRNLDIMFNGAIAAPPSKNNNAPMNPPSDKAYIDIIAKIATPIQRMTFDVFFILNSPINF